MNEYMLELLEEMVKPDEMALDNQLEDTIESEDDIVFGTAETDDEIIMFIDNGERIGYVDPVDFTDPDVDDAVYDDIED